MRSHAQTRHHACTQMHHKCGQPRAHTHIHSRAGTRAGNDPGCPLVPPLFTRPSRTTTVNIRVSFGCEPGREQSDKRPPRWAASRCALSPSHAPFDTCKESLLSSTTQPSRPNFRAQASGSRGALDRGTGDSCPCGPRGVGEFLQPPGSSQWTETLSGDPALFLKLANKFLYGNKAYFLMKINFFGTRYCYDFLFSSFLCFPRHLVPWSVLTLW